MPGVVAVDQDQLSGTFNGSPFTGPLTAVQVQVVQGTSAVAFANVALGPGGPLALTTPAPTRAKDKNGNPVLLIGDAVTGGGFSGTISAPTGVRPAGKTLQSR